MLTNTYSEIGETIEQSAAQCAAFMVERLAEAIAQNGRATLAVSGGSTPAKLFPNLAAATLDWRKVQLFFVDERMVPPDNEASNYRLAKTLLVDAAGIPAENVHRIHGEEDPEEAAEAYAQEISEVFGLDEEEDEIPALDLLHLGMGPDAHVASLFPGEAAIDNLDDLTAAVWVEKMNMWRVTLLPAVLQAARCTVVLAGGADKAAPLRDVLVEPYNPRRLPAQLVRHNLEVRWFLEKAAGAGRRSEGGLGDGGA